MPPSQIKYDESLVKKVGFWLTLFLSLKILGYFTISENIALTRVLKVFVRLLTSGGIILLYLNLLRLGFIGSFNYKNLMSPILYLLYLFMGLASLLWTSSFSVTLLQLFMTFETVPFVIIFLLIISMVNHYYPKNKLYISSIFASSIFWIIFIFVVGMYVNPDQFFRLTHGGEVARLGGFMMNPNELGMLAVVGLAGVIQEIYERGIKVKWAAFFVLLLYGLLMTQSRSSLGSFILITGFFILKSDNLKIKFAVAVIGVLVAPVLVNTIILKQGDLQEVLSMTGRIPFWKALLLEGFPREPWLGFGFMRIDYTDYFSSVHTYAARMTHNTFIQVLLNLGIIGFGIVVAQMAATIRAVFISKNIGMVVFFWAIYIPIFINSVTEFGIFGENNFGILFYQFLIFLFVVEYNPKLNSKEKFWQKRLYRSSV